MDGRSERRLTVRKKYRVQIVGVCVVRNARQPFQTSAAGGTEIAGAGVGRSYIFHECVGRSAVASPTTVFVVRLSATELVTTCGCDFVLSLSETLCLLSGSNSVLQEQARRKRRRQV